MTSWTVVAPVCASVAAALHDPPAVDLVAPTPCADFDLRALVEHVVGTTGAMARLGFGEPLDPDAPWGGGEGAAEEDWPAALQRNLDAIARGWSTEDAWTGTVDAGSARLPAAMVGGMALVEVTVHGWDLARALGRDLTLPDETAVVVLGAATETAELGRSMGAYGAEVGIAQGASPWDRVLGVVGRDPSWRR